MIDNDKFDFILGDLLDELPEAFFMDLQAGIIVSEEAPLSKHDLNNDLYVFGQYMADKYGNQIIIYKGSFDKFYSHLNDTALTDKMREVVRHEFRHHMENLSGISNSESLEAEDARYIGAYIEAHAKES